MRKKSLLNASNVVIFAFGTAFLSRCLDTFGAPSTINFLHFLTVPFACWVALVKTKGQDPQQRLVVQALLSGLLGLLAVIIASALWNDAGAINGVLSFLLLGEPFILLIAVVAIPMKPKTLEKLQRWIARFFILNTGVALMQYHVLKMHLWHTKGLEGADHIQGVFWKSGAGHVVGSSVALVFGCFYLIMYRATPLWLRISFVALAFWQMLIADAKQVLLAFIVGAFFLIFTKFKDVVAAIKFISGVTIIGAIFWWCINNVDAFSSFTVWIRPEIYGADGEATLLKTAAFRLVPNYYESFVNSLLGIGPGHTVGRLGGWMLYEYDSLLSPLGSTLHPVSGEVWRAVGTSWLGDQSSLFSPLFGWAGIWGDLGLLGLAAYMALGWITLHFLCNNDVATFTVFTVAAVGLVFTQMEEPSYMLSVAMLVGLSWHQQRAFKTSKKRISQRYFVPETSAQLTDPSI